MIERSTKKRINIFPLRIFLLSITVFGVSHLRAQHSIARKWNEVVLEGIRNDYARPTVHARNLFHTSAAMYDAWAIFSKNDQTYLIGNTVHGFISPFEGFRPFLNDDEFLKNEAISYTAYRLIEHRFSKSPGHDIILSNAKRLFIDELGFDPTFRSIDYQSGSAAALGNYIASQYIAYGLSDGSNEIGNYENLYYQTVNESINLENPGNPNIFDPNRWQPISFDLFIDQSGNEIPGDTPKFLGPEWGNVAPFSLKETDRAIKQRDGNSYVLYHDPGPPPYLDTITGGELYQWNFSLVAIWSAHLDANFDQELDISPASLGNFNLSELPTTFDKYPTFYNYLEGGDPSTGHSLNPITKKPYSPQVVKLGDYARILAEFWADGPNSETPPGHWFTLLNYVNDQPELIRKLGGQGPVLDHLEWDIKSYFILGGAMHDVAVTAWGIKGYYDYVRPVSAIRYMADKGQSTDPELPNYHAAGIPLVDGYIELVKADDPLVGDDLQNLHKIKLKAWKGPAYITDPKVDVAGVDWILAENWWPYQRPTFITPPFAGYISGHSTFSRAAAEVLTRLTGDPFFPRGMGVFDAPKNEFLVFEEGPSENIELEWATYQDASDQCSLSRIWGGIHPPADDINGRLIGYRIGNDAYDFAQMYFNQSILRTNPTIPQITIYPNPAADLINIKSKSTIDQLVLYDSYGKVIKTQKSPVDATLEVSHLPKGNYILRINSNGFRSYHKILIK